jgi:hypothetical protein
MTTTITRKQLAQVEQVESIERLRQLFAGDKNPTLHTILRHVSASGMTRDISLVYVKDGQLYNVTYSAALALGWPLSERSGYRAIRVGGCGMDMGFHLVYTLSSVLFRNSTDSDAGYTLKQEWL